MGGLLDKQSAVLRADLASKQDLKDLENNLKDYIDQGVESVMGGMDSLSEQMAERGTVDELGAWAVKAADKIGLKIKNHE